MISSRRIYTLKETALHGQFTSKIIEGVLGYQGPADGAEYTVASEQSILRGSVDLALGRFAGKIPELLAPFELKGADAHSDGSGQLFQRYPDGHSEVSGLT